MNDKIKLKEISIKNDYTFLDKGFNFFKPKKNNNLSTQDVINLYKKKYNDFNIDEYNFFINESIKALDEKIYREEDIKLMLEEINSLREQINLIQENYITLPNDNN